MKVLVMSLVLLVGVCANVSRATALMCQQWGTTTICDNGIMKQQFGDTTIITGSGQFESAAPVLVVPTQPHLFNQQQQQEQPAFPFSTRFGTCAKLNGRTYCN